MYLLFRDFGWLPSQFYRMGDGEKIVVRAFLERYYEDQEKDAKKMRQQIPKGRGRHR